MLIALACRGILKFLGFKVFKLLSKNHGGLQKSCLCGVIALKKVEEHRVKKNLKSRECMIVVKEVLVLPAGCQINPIHCLYLFRFCQSAKSIQYAVTLTRKKYLFLEMQQFFQISL